MLKQHVCVLMMVVAGAAAAQDTPWGHRGWFAGATVGAAEMEEVLYDDGDVVAENIDDQDTAYGVHAGFQFSRYFGLEAGLYNFGSYEADDAADRVDIDARGGTFMVYGRVPVGERVAFVGKAGVVHSRTETTLVRDGVRHRDTDRDGGPAFEAAVQFRLSPQWDALVQVGRYDLELVNFRFEFNNDDDDDVVIDVSGVDRYVTTAQVGVRYRF